MCPILWVPVKNPVYTGRAVYNSKGETGEVDTIEIPTPRLVSDLTFELAQNRLESLESDAKRGGGNREYLLSRKIVDLETGRKFVGVSRSRDGKTNYRRKAFAFE